jgi:hypothetical protein
MTHRATRDVVRRVMPLLEKVAPTTVDRARLLQYLSARAGVDWGAMEAVSDEAAEPEVGAAPRRIVVRDSASGEARTIAYPSCLDPALEPLVIEEYKRLAVGDRLTLMAQPLFDHFFAESHCAGCRWRGAEFAPFHRECRFAGHPVNFEPAGNLALDDGGNASG